LSKSKLMQNQRHHNLLVRHRTVRVKLFLKREVVLKMK